MIKRLDEFVIGETGQIKKVDGEGRLRKRLFDMGVTPGTEVYLRKKAPLGDPIIVNFRGLNLALRKSDAKNIYLKDNEVV